MIEIEKMIEIVKAARALGATRITFGADGSVDFEWTWPPQYSATAQIEFFKLPSQPAKPFEIFPPVVAMYMAQGTEVR
jgi:P pilus assembly chaperone PapD